MRINLLHAHGMNQRYRAGCRCWMCRSARAAFEQSRRDGTLVRSPGAQHGTRTMYVKGCRCEECVTVSRNYDTDRRRACGIQERRGIPEHGTNARYSRNRGRPGCRCELCRQAASQHRQERKDALARNYATYRAAHGEEIRARGVARYAANREKLRARGVAWYAANLEKCRARGTAYNAAHVEEKRAYSVAWRAAHPDEVRAKDRNRRARKRNAPGAHTAADVAAQRARQKGKCYWCRARVGRHYHVDHVIPLSRGGSNGPENLVIACPPCNLSKHAKHPMEFAGVMF